MYALSHYTRGTLGLVNLFCRTWSISSLNGVKFYAEGGKWECRHQGRPKTYSEEQIRFAYELRKQGMTYKMIERKTGISKRTQQRRFKLVKNNIF